jgi:hypothetical protein
METGGTGAVDILFSYDTAEGMRVYRSRAGREVVRKPDFLEVRKGVENARILELEKQYPVVIFESWRDRRVCIRSKEAPQPASGTIQEKGSIEIIFYDFDDTKAQACYDAIVQLYEKGYAYDHCDQRRLNGKHGVKVSAETLVFVTRDKTKPRFWGDTVAGFFTKSQLTIPLETLHRIDRLLADC